MRKSNTRRIILSVLLLLLSSVSHAVACAKVFVYDSAGRTTSVTTSAGTTTLSWDYEDRLTGITYPSTATNSFGYNAFGARVSKTDSTGTSTYARNGVGVTSPVLSDGNLTYTPGISSNDGSDSTWSHGDIKNSLRQTGENESTTATTQFDAFGNPVSATGTWSGPFQYGGPFGYQTDSDSGLKLLGHRYYDASTGRFLSRDPIKDGRNWLAYCNSNPISFLDPDGRELITIIVIGGLVIGAVTTGLSFKKASDRMKEGRKTQHEMAQAFADGDDVTYAEKRSTTMQYVREVHQMVVDQLIDIYIFGLINKFFGVRVRSLYAPTPGFEARTAPPLTSDFPMPGQSTRILID